MAGKTQFTDEEWESLRKGVTGAGLLVSVSDRGFFDTFKEAGALAKHLVEARRSSGSELVRELSEGTGTGFGMTASPAEVETQTLQALSSAKTTLEQKAPDELEPYRSFVLEVAESVARAAGGVATAETGALDKIKAALAAG